MTLTKKIKRISLGRLLLIAVIAMTALGTTSCGDEYYEYSPIEGRWELVEIDGYPVREPDVSEFTFFGDGTGVYGQYNPYPNWNESRISWELDFTGAGAEYLYIYTYGGGTWRYLLRLYPSYMELTDLDTGQRLTYRSY